jgi:hypothetical protein
MNYIMRVIALFFASCSSHFLYGTDEWPVFSATEWLFRHLVLTEPHAEHANPFAWRIDSTKTAAAVACVDKKWNALHKKYIADPRKELMEAHQHNFDAVHLSSLLCNNYAQYCCLVSKNNHIKALFGVVGSRPDVFLVRPWKYGQAAPEHITSTTITYYNENKQKIEAPAFQCTPRTITQDPQICIILPEEKQRYTFYLKSNSYGLTSCTPTINKIIQATFELSEDPNFWSYNFSKNGVVMTREVNTANVLISLKNEYFKNICANISALHTLEIIFSEDSCSCGTNHIDHACKDNYETVCKILAEEGATHLKPHFLMHFFRGHICHQIGYLQIGNHTKAIYINPYGTIYSYTPRSNQPTYESIVHNASPTPTLSIDSLQAVAATHARKWYTMGNLLLRKDTKKILYYSYDTLNNKFISNYLTLKNLEKVLDGITIYYKYYHVDIFVLQQTASKRTKLLFGPNAVKAHASGASEQHILKRGLARMLHERNIASYALMPPEEEIATFMRFIKGIENPIKNIEEIYPKFDYASSNNYPFHF